MKKFTVCYYDDCRGIFEIGDVNVIECNSGREVFESVVKNMRSDDSEWDEYMDAFMGCGDGSFEVSVEEMVEGDIESGLFNIVIGEESGCLVIEGDREDISEKEAESLLLRVLGVED